MTWLRSYVKERKAFGKPLAGFQNTQFKLAELRTELDIAQTYVDQCVAAFNEGSTHRCGRSESQAGDVGAAGQGGGYRGADARWCRLHGRVPDFAAVHRRQEFQPIYAGTSEVMKIIISRDCLGEDYQSISTRNF